MIKKTLFSQIEWKFFALKYMISSMLMGSALSLMQAPQILWRIVMGRLAVTAKDKKGNMTSF